MLSSVALDYVLLNFILIFTAKEDISKDIQIKMREKERETTNVCSSIG